MGSRRHLETDAAPHHVIVRISQLNTRKSVPYSARQHNLTDNKKTSYNYN